MTHLQSQLRGHIPVVLGALHKGSVQGFENKGIKVEVTDFTITAHIYTCTIFALCY